MADVAGGSTTPSMVRQVRCLRRRCRHRHRTAATAVTTTASAVEDALTLPPAPQVLAWRNDPARGASAVWDRLAAANERAMAALSTLARLPDALGEGVYDERMAALASVPAAAVRHPPASPRLRRASCSQALPVACNGRRRRGGPVRGARCICGRARPHAVRWRGRGQCTLPCSLAAHRAMGEAAGVPIEPAQQTELADATEALPGVLTALVPGGQCCGRRLAAMLRHSR